jgi:hypothetical protein
MKGDGWEWVAILLAVIIGGVAAEIIATFGFLGLLVAGFLGPVAFGMILEAMQRAKKPASYEPFNDNPYLD